MRATLVIVLVLLASWVPAGTMLRGHQSVLAAGTRNAPAITLCTTRHATVAQMAADSRVLDDRLVAGFGLMGARVRVSTTGCVRVDGVAATNLPAISRLASEKGVVALTDGGRDALSPGARVRLVCETPGCAPGAPMGRTDLRSKPFPTLRVILSGTSVKHNSAFVRIETSGFPSVVYELRSSASLAWCRFTSAHVGTFTAVVLDGVVVVDPSIQAGICEGQVQISGISTVQRAKEIAAYLDSGPLPVPLPVRRSGAWRGAWRESRG